MRIPCFAVVVALAGCHAPPSSVVSGMVVIDGDGDASGVTVRAVGPASATTSTDKSGAYRLPGLPSGDYEVIFSANDTLEKTVVRAAHVGSALTVPLVRFTAVGSIAGTITLAGQPSSGANVFVDRATAIATSDAAGHYRLDNVPAGAAVLEAVMSGYSPGSLAGLAVTRGQITAAPPLDLAADTNPTPPAATLVGTALRIDRTDHAGTMVTATSGVHSFSTTTGKDGSYRFDDIPTGVYRIDFTYDGHHETIPQVLALASSTGQVIDGSLYPLATNPIQLPVARRLVSTGAASSASEPPVTILDGERALVVLPGSNPQQRELEVLSLDSGALTLIADGISSWSGVPSSDHTHVLFELPGASSSVAVLQLGATDGSAPTTLAPLAYTYGYTFAAGDTRVLYTVDQQLRSVPTSGGNATVLATSVRAFWLHPDGKRVVYESCPTGGTCDVSVRTLDGGTPLPLLTGVTDPVAFAPDGAHVVGVAGYDTQQYRGQLIVAAVDSGAQATPWTGGLRAWSTFSPDGRWLAFSSDGSDLRLVDLRSASPTPTAVTPTALYPTFTTDESRFIYQRDRQAGSWPFYTPTYTLLQQPSGGGAEITLGAHVSSYTLSPDNRQLAFIDQLDFSTNFGRLRIADASGAAMTLVDSGAGAPLFSPDGAHVIYETNDPADTSHFVCWSVPSAGGKPAQLGETWPSALTFSPGGTYVTLLAADGVMRVVPTGGGTPLVAGWGASTWATDTRLVLDVYGQAAPYRHQNGIYVFEVAP